MTRRLPPVLLPDDLADKVDAAAAADRRSVSDWVRLTIEAHLDAEDGISGCEGCRKRLPSADMHTDDEGAELCDDCWSALLAEAEIDRRTEGKG